LISNDYLDFLGKFEAIYETALPMNQGPVGRGFIDEKTEGRKSCDNAQL
jgi:hypothetical protein